MSFEGPQSVSQSVIAPPNPLYPIEAAKVGYCPMSRPVLFTIITLKSDSWFRSTGDFCGRLYRSGVLMSSRGAVANGVVSGVHSKRPRWDYHSQGGLRKVLPAQALRVRATHFRGQGKLSNEQTGLSLPCFKGYNIIRYCSKAWNFMQMYIKAEQTYVHTDISFLFQSIHEGIITEESHHTVAALLYHFSSLSNFSTVVVKSYYRDIDRDFTKLPNCY